MSQLVIRTTVWSCLSKKSPYGQLEDKVYYADNFKARTAAVHCRRSILHRDVQLPHADRDAIWTSAGRLPGSPLLAAMQAGIHLSWSTNIT